MSMIQQLQQPRRLLLCFLRMMMMIMKKRPSTTTTTAAAVCCWHRSACLLFILSVFAPLCSPLFCAAHSSVGLDGLVSDCRALPGQSPLPSQRSCLTTQHFGDSAFAVASGNPLTSLQRHEQQSDDHRNSASNPILLFSWRRRRRDRMQIPALSTQKPRAAKADATSRIIAIITNGCPQQPLCNLGLPLSRLSLSTAAPTSCRAASTLSPFKVCLFVLHALPKRTIIIGRRITIAAPNRTTGRSFSYCSASWCFSDSLDYFSRPDSLSSQRWLPRPESRLSTGHLNSFTAPNSLSTIASAAEASPHAVPHTPLCLEEHQISTATSSSSPSSEAVDAGFSLLHLQPSVLPSAVSIPSPTAPLPAVSTPTPTLLPQRLSAETQVGNIDIKACDRSAEQTAAAHDGLTLLFPENCPVVTEEAARQLTEGQPKFCDHPQVSESTARALGQKGITHMTPIQTQTIPLVHEGRDILGRSRTGTGKTLAFAVPLCDKLAASLEQTRCSRNPKVLVLEPTRELARQVEEEFKTVAAIKGLRTACFHGGANYGPQHAAIYKGVDILVSTPGRLNDHLQKQSLRLDDVRHVVLDEADEMLNMGFTDDIERIMSKIQLEDSQMLLFSATTPQWVHDISRKYLKRPVTVDVVGRDAQRTSKSVRHVAVRIPEDSMEARAAVLEDIVAVESRGSQTIVFTNTKREADELSSEGEFKAFSAKVLHGDIGQQTRDHTMQRFKKGLFKILVATDVAARGIDVGGVSLVIQCSPPTAPDQYVHRSGRTGRGGRSGTSVLLYSEGQRWEVKKLEEACGIKFEMRAPPSTQAVMTSAAMAVSRQLDGITKSVLPYFRSASLDLLKRAAEKGVSHEELLSRCLAVMAKKQEVATKSLLSGLPGLTTVEIANTERQWRDTADVHHWIHVLANDLGINLPLISAIYISADGRNVGYFDLPTRVAESLVGSVRTDQQAVQAGRRTYEGSPPPCVFLSVRDDLTQLPKVLDEAEAEPYGFRQRSRSQSVRRGGESRMMSNRSRGGHNYSRGGRFRSSPSSEPHARSFRNRRYRTEGQPPSGYAAPYSNGFTTPAAGGQPASGDMRQADKKQTFWGD